MEKKVFHLLSIYLLKWKIVRSIGRSHTHILNRDEKSDRNQQLHKGNHKQIIKTMNY